MKAGQGPGKTFLISIILFHQLWCYTNSIIPCTAPTQHQLTNLLWRECALRMAKSKILSYFFVWTATKIAVRGSERTWYAVAIPSNNPDTLTGFHNENLLYLIDEAPGLPESAFQVIEGALTEEGNKVIMIGNPVRNTGYFKDAFGKNKADWGTMTMSCMESTRVSQKWIDRMARLFGKDSNVYRVRVLGKFPKSEDDSILDIDLVTDAMNREEPLEKLDVIEGGCDVARFGANKTVIYIRHGYKIIDECVIDKSDATVVQDAIIRLIRKHNPSLFKIDETGVGGPIVDNVRKECDKLHIVCDIIGVNNNQVAINENLFENAGIEMFWELREILKVAVIPNNNDLFEGLLIRKYFTNTKSKRLQMISKEELIKQLKKQKVNYAFLDYSDALALTFYTPAHSGSGSVEAFYEEDRYQGF